MSASYLNWPISQNLQSESVKNDILLQKRTFQFLIGNFPFICRNIPAPAYGVYISKSIRYCRTCDSYNDSVEIALLLARKLLNQEFLVVKLKSTLGRIYGLICVTKDYGYVPFVVFTIRSFHYSVMIVNQICNNSNTTDATCGAGNAYPSRTPEYT